MLIVNRVTRSHGLNWFAILPPRMVELIIGCLFGRIAAKTRNARYLMPKQQPSFVHLQAVDIPLALFPLPRVRK